MDRPAAVAGSFYPANPSALRTELNRCLSSKGSRLEALGCIVPHAGYVYSGAVAGAVYSRLERPETVILLGPNHTGRGRPLSVLSQGRWETPLGPVAVAEPLAAALIESIPDLETDGEAHRLEHSLEVQLPFLLHLWPSVQIVPIVSGVDELSQLESLGSGLARVLMDLKPKPLIIASSDMNHYENDRVSREKDRLALDRILDLDARGLHDTVQANRISMCGYGPAVAMLTASCMLGAETAELIRYANSGEVTGDTDSVVGYAGVVVQ